MAGWGDKVTISYHGDKGLMERRAFDKNKPEETIEWIYRNAMGTIVPLGAAPTAQEHMKANTIGFYGNDLYIRLDNGEIKKVTLTAVV